MEEDQRIRENQSLKFQPAPANAPPVNVALPNGTKYAIAIDANFDNVAGRAVEYVRNRRQWRKLASARDYIEEILDAYFPRSNPTRDDQLKEMARASLVEIQIPRATGESAYVFPWEFAISEITAKFRGARSLLVTRQLDGAGTATPVNWGVAPTTILVAQSAPGAISNSYSFESEDKLVQSSFSIPQFLPTVSDPTIDVLTASVLANPSVVHLTGVDGLQGASLLKVPEEGPALPGVYLAGPECEPKLESPEAVATAVTSGNPKPMLVSYNFYNSAWPLASMTVDKGAAVAIGFQDEIDDALAEIFFARFYESWERSGWNLISACRESLKSLQEYSAKLRGTGIVLWSATSLLPFAKTTQSGTTQQASVGPETLVSAATIADIDSVLRVVVEPCAKLNYSMLHNNRPLFDKFEVKRQSKGRLANIRVDVVLDTGSGNATYSTTFDLSRARPMVDVSALARVSLTSEMALSLRESVYTSLQVSVRWEERLAYQNTFRVAMLPTDEWRDDDLNRIWLPSFVLPRDPAIADIVDKAQKYLSAFEDDCGAGFDGYQGVLAPVFPIDQQCQSVDDQVRAIWWALLQEYQLSYINPPPSFTQTSQRLRTPSSIIAGKRGTCIDLTLLLAALLEYVDIYPVVFLLDGHAFPGYLRSLDSYTLLRKIFLDPATSARSNGSTPPETTIQREWILDQRYYAALIELVRQGHIVPIESVALTQAAGFDEAVNQGTQDLRSKADFQFLVDIKSAREADVTPIPMWSIRA
ncbi:MAG TPA: hypothetical protein VMU05_06445 [Dongiaceae bacterium]|nr:hypothetical protein [Dongiaceae bacterium]